MKHLLNNLTEEEKNAIREQHTGGMKVMNENFSKLVNTKLGDVKPMINEQYEENEENDTDRLQLMLQNKSADVVSEHLNNLSDSIRFIAIINCEYADFSDIDVCSMRNLAFINLAGTDNNFDEQDYECAEHFGEELYSLIDKDEKRM